MWWVCSRCISNLYWLWMLDSVMMWGVVGSIEIEVVFGVVICMVCL